MKEDKGFKNELVCYQCGVKVFRTTSAPVYADLAEHYKAVHGLDMKAVQMLRRKGNSAVDIEKAKRVGLI